MRCASCSDPGHSVLVKIQIENGLRRQRIQWRIQNRTLKDCLRLQATQLDLSEPSGVLGFEAINLPRCFSVDGLVDGLIRLRPCHLAGKLVTDNRPAPYRLV